MHKTPEKSRQSAWVNVPLVRAVNDILADVAMPECFLNGNRSFLAKQIQKEKSPSLLTGV